MQPRGVEQSLKKSGTLCLAFPFFSFHFLCKFSFFHGKLHPLGYMLPVSSVRLPVSSARRRLSARSFVASVGDTLEGLLELFLCQADRDFFFSQVVESAAGLPATRSTSKFVTRFSGGWRAIAGNVAPTYLVAVGCFGGAVRRRHPAQYRLSTFPDPVIRARCRRCCDNVRVVLPAPARATSCVCERTDCFDARFFFPTLRRGAMLPVFTPPPPAHGRARRRADPKAAPRSSRRSPPPRACAGRA